jgi:hypothetical protein
MATDPTARDTAIGSRIQIAVLMLGGTLLEGTAVMTLDGARPRLLDALNRLSQRFVELYTAEGTVLLNRELIVHVEQVA